MKLKRTKTVDMSPEAIDRRLREVAALHRLGMAMRTAKRIGKVRDLDPVQTMPPASHSVGQDDRAEQGKSELARSRR